MTGSALRDSSQKITVFLLAVAAMVVVLGTIMYVGDISPKTPLGQTLASPVMILGYGVIAVPTGIVTAELSSGRRPNPVSVSTQICASCGLEQHEADARFCRRCGAAL